MCYPVIKRLSRTKPDNNRLLPPAALPNDEVIAAHELLEFRDGWSFIFFIIRPIQAGRNDVILFASRDQERTTRFVEIHFASRTER